MRNKKILAGLALFPIILSGCASNGAGDTPFFANEDKVATAVATAPPLNGDTETTKPTESKSTDTEKEKTKTSAPESNNAKVDPPKDSKSSEPKNPDGTVKIDFAKEYAKEHGLKLDKNGNPYQESSTSDDAITSVTRPKDSADLEEEANRSKATPEQETGGMKSVNSMIAEAKDKNWKSACKFVYLSEDDSNDGCVVKMKRVYADGVNFANFTSENVQSMAKSKEILSLTLKGKNYEESQHTTLILDDGTWKVLFM